MSDRDRLRAEAADRLGVVVDDIVDAIARNRTRVAACLGNGGGVTRPAGCDRVVARLAEELDPSAPRVCVQPKTVDKNNWCACLLHQFSSNCRLKGEAG